MFFSVCLLFAACGKAENNEEDAYRQFGINCLMNGKYPEAIDAFQSALSRAGGHVGEKELDICFYKARAQYLSGDAEAARDTYDAVISYNGDPRAYYLRGKLLFDLGEREEGLADFGTAVREAGGNYELYIGIYSVMSVNGLAEEGQQYLDQAMGLPGETAEDCFYKGRICLLMKDYDGAASYLEKAEEEDVIKAAFYLGQVYETLGEEERARECIRRYLDSGVATSYELYELGNEEMADGDYEQAIVYYNAGLALQSVPNKQNLMKSMIVAYEYSGDFALARGVMEDYLKLYPSDEEAQKEYIFLQTR